MLMRLIHDLHLQKVSQFGNIFYECGVVVITETGSWSSSIDYTSVLTDKYSFQFVRFLGRRTLPKILITDSHQSLSCEPPWMKKMKIRLDIVHKVILLCHLTNLALTGITKIIWYVLHFLYHFLKNNTWTIFF